MLYEIQPERGDKTAEEWRLDLAAAREIAEYRLVAAGAATYQGLGYRTAEGEAPAVKLMAWLAVDAEIKMAERERANR